MKLNLSERGGLACLFAHSRLPEGKSTANNRSQEGQGAGGGERQVGCCPTGSLFVCLLFAQQTKQPNKQTLGRRQNFCIFMSEKTRAFSMFLPGFRLKSFSLLSAVF